jgi:hypothetical protein
MHNVFLLCAVAGVRPTETNRRVARAELEGETPATFAAGIAGKPALTAEDPGNALWDGLAAPTARRDDGRAAEKIIPRMRIKWAEATTTVASRGAFHLNPSRNRAANAKILKLLEAEVIPDRTIAR